MSKLEILLKRYPTRVPFQVQSQEFNLKKSKFLVERSSTWLEIYLKVRNQLKLHHTECIFLFIGDVLPSLNENVGKIYDMNKNKSSLICLIHLHKENTFG